MAAGFPPWWALAPFGRVGHALGFRWRFWWTLPLPYHPLLPAIFLLAPLALLVWGSVRLLGGGSAPVSWVTLLITGFALVVPLSIPILNMAFLLLKVQFLQGLCFLTAMVLLAIEVATGRAAPYLAVLPIIYFGAHVWQLVTSRAALARFRRDAANYRPVVLAGRPVALRGEQLWSEAQALLNSGVANVVCCDDAERTGSVSLAGNTALLVEVEAADGLRETMPKPLTPRGWGILGKSIVQVPGWTTEPEVRVGWTSLPRRQTGPSGHAVTIRDGDSCQTLVIGRASAVMPVPLFFLAYMVAWNGGRSAWMAGFWRGRTQQIGPAGSEKHEGVTSGLFAAPDGPVAPVDGEPLFALLARAQDAMLADARAELLRYLGDEIRWPKEVRRLQARPQALAGLGPAICDFIDSAKTRRDEAGAKLGAELLSLIGAEEFQLLERRLLPVLGSRVLALRWELTPDLDLAPLPKLCPKFGNQAGFGLMERVPQLWERLGELGPKAAGITAAFIKEVGARPMLAKARERFADRGIVLPDYPE